MTKARPSVGKSPKSVSKAAATASPAAKSTPKTTPKSTPSKAKGKAKPKQYGAFVTIPLALPFPSAGSSSSSSKETATHYLFVRPHAKADAGSDGGRTLFAANVPLDAGERDLRALFGNWGVVESVEISGLAGGDVLEAAVRGLPVEDDSDSEAELDEDEEEETVGQEPKAEFVGTAQQSRKRRRKPNTLPASVPSVSPLPTPPASLAMSGMRTATITFVDAVSVSRAMSYTGPPLPLDPSEEMGLARYEKRYTALRPPLASVRAHADSAMARHDHLHSLLLASRAKAHGAGALVDEDGFTVVVRGGRYGRTAGRKGDAGGAGVAVASRAAAAAAVSKKKGRGAGELKDFYKFQSQDRKRKELADLRARFDEDRRKVEDLKKSRRFKPY